MIINEVDCSAPWGWIPLIDMAVVLCEIRDKLKSRDVETEVFDFTENDATITFEKTNEFLRITTNYGPTSQLVQFLEFDNQVTKFRENVFAASLNLIPSLETSSAFQSLRSAASQNAE